MAEFKLRLKGEPVGVTSELVSQWLDSALKDGVALAADPGGGEYFLNVTADSEKLEALAQRAGCKPSVALRRLVATNAQIPTAEASVKMKLPRVGELPPRTMPKPVQMTADDLVPGVRMLNRGVALVYGVDPALTPQEDRELGAALAEVMNRRSPAWLISNGDLIKATLTFGRWSMAQTSALDAKLKEKREREKGKGGKDTAVKPSADGFAPATSADEMQRQFANAAAFGGGDES